MTSIRFSGQHNYKLVGGHSLTPKAQRELENQVLNFEPTVFSSKGQDENTMRVFTGPGQQPHDSYFQRIGQILSEESGQPLNQVYRYDAEATQMDYNTRIG